MRCLLFGLIRTVRSFSCVFSDPVWTSRLSRLDRSSARQLKDQLTSQNALGYRAEPKSGSMLKEVFEWKEQHFHKVLLVRVGEFYEAWGVDAIMLVEHCGLNAMGGKARAGCPIRNVQPTLDGLTNAGLSVAVYEEDDDTKNTGLKKSRSLSQIVSPGAATYVTKDCLFEDVEFRQVKPYACVSTEDGGDSWSVVFLDVDSRLATMTEGLSRDGAKALLSTSFVPPLYHHERAHLVDASRHSAERLAGEIHEEKARLPDTTDAAQALSLAVAQELSLDLDSFANDVSVRRSTRRKPLFAHSAREIGLYDTPDVPSLLKRLLPTKAHATSKVWLRQWLASPPSLRSANAMRSALSALSISSGSVAIPKNIPCRRKLVRLLAERQGNCHFFHELADACRCSSVNLRDPLLEAVCDPLKTLVEIEEDERVDADAAADIVDAITSVVLDQSESDEAPTGGGDFVPSSFFAKNEETFLGTVRREGEYGAARDAVDLAASILIKAVEEDFGGALACHDIVNNVLYLKKRIPEKKMIHPRDRHRREMSGKFTTDRVDAALADYSEACGRATKKAAKALQNLCEKLDIRRDDVLGATAFSEVMTVAVEHAYASALQGWGLPTASSTERSLDLRGLSPYWLDRATSVRNDVELNPGGVVVLTGPNAAGKSTTLRSVATAALLGSAGLHAPVTAARIPSRLDAVFIRAASRGDAPSLGKSAFSREMDDVALLLRECTEDSLVLVDEIGRGTSATEASALCASLLIEFAERRYSGIFATHLHEMIPLLPHNFFEFWRTRIEYVDKSPEFTYVLEKGISNQSLALHCAQRAGIPSNILERARDMIDDDDENDSSLETEQEDSLQVFKRIVESKAREEAVLVDSGREPPPRLAHVSCVYALDLGDDLLYVGETDNVRTRLNKHRKKGPRWLGANAVVSPTTDKSQARQLETLVIRELMARGVPLASTADSRHILKPPDDLLASE